MLERSLTMDVSWTSFLIVDRSKLVRYDHLCWASSIYPFFLATVSAEGAPYIQHRGGPKGFIKVLDDKTLGFADFAGNKQYITISNLAGNDRAYLFLLDFARQRRIKLWGRARVVEDDPALLATLSDPGYRARPERALLEATRAPARVPRTASRSAA